MTAVTVALDVLLSALIVANAACVWFWGRLIARGHHVLDSWVAIVNDAHARGFGDRGDGKNGNPHAP